MAPGSLAKTREVAGVQTVAAGTAVVATSNMEPERTAAGDQIVAGIVAALVAFLWTHSHGMCCALARAVVPEPCHLSVMMNQLSRTCQPTNVVPCLSMIVN